MGTATTAVDTAVAVTITDGTEAAVTTNGTTIAAGKAFAVFAFRHSHCPDGRPNSSDANGRAVEARPVQRSNCE
jgi:hypothetical protein